MKWDWDGPTIVVPEAPELVPENVPLIQCVATAPELLRPVLLPLEMFLEPFF